MGPKARYARLSLRSRTVEAPVLYLFASLGAAFISGGSDGTAPKPDIPSAPTDQSLHLAFEGRNEDVQVEARGLMPGSQNIVPPDLGGVHLPRLDGRRLVLSDTWSLLDRLPDRSARVRISAELGWRE